MSAGQHSAARVGRYILEHRVASGGMGEVFSARAVGAAGTSKRVCIKRILASRKLTEGAVAHFISEAKLSMQLSHANVVPVFDFGRADDGYYLVMEWVDGVDLGVVLEASIRQRSLFSVAEVAYIGARLAHGLAHAHSQKIIHRDVKPSNLLLSRAGQIHLTDFGVAMLSGTDLPAAGTPAYMAPEQRWGFDLDARADVFAMGVTLHHLATGKLSRSPAEVREVAPEPFRELFARMIAPLVEDRPADMEEVSRELERMESLAVAGGAELPRVSLQRRVAQLAVPKPSQDASLELPFMTAASLAAMPLTFTTDTSLADDAGTDAGTPQHALPIVPRLDATPAPGGDTPHRGREDVMGSASTLDAGDAANPPAERRMDERGVDERVRPPMSKPVRALLWALPPAALLVAGGLWFASNGAPPSHPDGTRPSASSATTRSITARSVGADPVATASPAHATRPAPDPSAGDRSAPQGTTPARAANDVTARPERGPRNAGTPAGMAPVAAAAPPAANDTPLEPEPAAAAIAESPAQLHIGARPWAEVYVDGQRVGQTPISALRLPPGVHQVRLVNGPLDAQRTISVRLAPGETRYLREDME